MAQDRKVSIILTAVDKTKQAFQSATRSLGRFTDKFSRFAGQLGLAFGVGGGGVVAGVKLLADEMDRLSKEAAKLGTTTEELSKLRFAAKQTGVDARVLGLGLQRMVRKIGDAANGSADAAKGFSRLGLDFKALAELSPEQQFAAISEKVSQLSNRTEQLSATVRIFDSEAAAVVNTLAEGPEAIAAYGDELEKLGGVIDQDTAAAAEQFSDNISRINERLRGMSVTLGNAVIPGLSAMAALLAGASFNQVLREMTEQVSILPAGVLEVTDEIRRLKTELADLREGGGLQGALLKDSDVETLIQQTQDLITRLEAELEKRLAAFAAKRKKQQQATAAQEVSLAQKLTDALADQDATRLKSKEDYLKQLEVIAQQEVDLLKRVENAGREASEGAAAVQVGPELDQGDLFLKFRDAIASLDSGDVEGARQTIENISAAMDQLNQKGELNSLVANQLRENLANLTKEIKAVSDQKVIDEAKIQEESEGVAKDIEENVKPQIKLELDPDSVRQIQESVLALWGDGILLPVDIYARDVVASGETRQGVGSQGETTYSDTAAAEGHKL